MATALRLVKPQPLAERPRDEWSQLPDFAREEAERRLLLIKPALTRMQMGVKRRAAAEWLATSAEGMPSLNTLQRWLKAYEESGIVGLAPNWKGRQRQERGCEHLILAYFRRSSVPDAGDVSFWLAQDHGLDVPSWWIHRYLKSLPSHVTDTARSRVGGHYYDQNIRPYHRRDVSDLAVGEAWVSDGHRIKLFSRHPNTQKLFRVEITPILDVACHYCYGFWVSAAESSMDTVYALCSVMWRFDHVPTWFQTDPGPGFQNKRVAALLERLGVEHVPTRAGNARGKGMGEGFFRIFNKRFSKQFDTYSGRDRTDDALARMQTKVNRGELTVPDLVEVKQRLEQFRETYNAWPQKGSDRLRGKSPNDRIVELERKPLHLPVEDLLRPFKVATVRHWEVRLRNRFYRHADLKAYDGRKVVVQYDEHDESQVWIRDAKHRLICVAALTGKTPWARESVAADARERSRRAAVGRKLDQIDEINARTRAPISAAAVLDALEFEAPAALPAPGSQLITQGHSLLFPAATPVPARPVREIDATELNLVREVLAEPIEDEESPEQRFYRWLQLDRQVQAGKAVEPGLAPWYRSYPESAEYLGLADVYHAFGYLPGVQEN